MRRSLASRAIALLSAATGGRSTRRWVFSATLSVSYSVSVPKSYSIVELQVAARLDLSTRRKCKRGAGVPSPPLELFSLSSPVQQDPADSNCSTVLLGCGLGHRYNRHEHAALGFGTELDATFDFREQRVVRAHADIEPRMPLRAALTRDDIARDDVLAAERLDAKALARRVAPVA